MKSKKSNPIGKGTVNIAINMPTDLKNCLASAATKNKLKVSEYCRIILKDAVDRGVGIEITTTLKHS